MPKHTISDATAARMRALVCACDTDTPAAVRRIRWLALLHHRRARLQAEFRSARSPQTAA